MKNSRRFGKSGKPSKPGEPISRHVVAEMLEACAICGTVREKVQLSRCRWCEDIYICKDGVCAQKHQADLHPAVAFWTW